MVFGLKAQRKQCPTNTSRCTNSCTKISSPIFQQKNLSKKLKMLKRFQCILGHISLVITLIVLGFSSAIAQSYEVEITPFSIEGLVGLQSYSVGTHEGEWLIVGGRSDGLHQRQPFAAFQEELKNEELLVVNPQEGKVWRASLSALPLDIQEHLSSSNMQFFQSGNDLICTGGYAYSPQNEDHITFPFLTIIDLPETIRAVKNKNVTSTNFKQVKHEDFRVTGGALNKIGEVYHLVGGHKFMGRYNPMGADQGPGFIQVYTHEIRRFKIVEEDEIKVKFLGEVHDEMHLRRRDYNLVPYITGDERRLMAFSGVFRNTADLPWLYPVSISGTDHQAQEDFTQYFNHYHCAHLPIYNKAKDDMHTLFFGGIAQFYVEDDVVVQDNDVPFVNTITDVTRTSTGELTESVLSTEMPGFLGAGSVFILNDEVALADNGILDARGIGDDFQEVGFIYGGIRSSLPNIFWLNTGKESEASATIYKVAIRKVESKISATIPKNESVQFYPNPESKLVRMSMYTEVSADLSISISDLQGKLIHKEIIDKSRVTQGRNYFVLENVNVGYGAFNYTLEVEGKVIKRKVSWSE